MAGSKINDYAIGDSNIQTVMLTLDKTFKGQHQVSLTNYDTTAESQVAAGSVIEIGGALYKFDSNESITGSPSDGTVYIMAVPAGDSVTCAYTNTAPTWSDSKQGWYGTGATVNNRYLEFKLKKTGGDWTEKDGIYFDSWTYTDPIYGLFSDGTPLYSKIITFSWDNTQSSQTLPHGISSAVTGRKIVSVLPVRRAAQMVINENFSATLVSWTNDNMTVTRSTTEARTYDAFIVYKR